MDWRRQLYEGYISTGQGGSDSETQYRKQAPGLRRIARAHLSSDRTQHILDLGCGAGGLLYVLAQMGYTNVWGVDLSAEMVEAARRNGLTNVKLGDLMSELKAQADASVDTVFALDILEHLDRQQLFDVVIQIFRVLRPGGRLIVHVPNAEGIFSGRVRYGDITHELAFTSSSMRQLMRSIGFADVTCHEDTPVVHGGPSFARALIWSLGTLPFRLLFAAETGSFHCILSQNMVAVARRP